MEWMSLSAHRSCCFPPLSVCPMRLGLAFSHLNLEINSMHLSRNLFKILFLAAVLVAPSLAQFFPINYYRVSVTSTSPIIDNRSSLQRRADYHGFCAVGTGVWAVTIQYSDTSASGPWVSFTQGAPNVSNANPTCYGSTVGYHAWLRFNI